VALAGEGPPVLLLHGWPQHWYLWRDVIPVVAPHARVIVPDLRGFGWTEVPETGYEKVQLARDVLALLDELGIGEVIVAGHDWGGYVGFLLAMEHPDRIRGLLAANILPPWPPRDRRVALDSWRFLYQPVLGTPHVGRRAGRAIARRGLADAGLSPTDVDAFVSRLEGERGVAGERLYRTFFFRELPGLTRRRYSPAALRTPTTLVFGQRDQVLSTRAVEDVARQSDRIELELVPDATHFVVDEKPELIADRALRLLASPVTG
jgi:pimeloyl-ACP methyl ester carboxylesterase